MPRLTFLFGWTSLLFLSCSGCGGKTPDKAEDPKLVLTDKESKGDRDKGEPEKKEGTHSKPGADFKKDVPVAAEDLDAAICKLAHEKSRELRGWCEAILGKKGDALDKLEKAYPKLYPHVVVLAGESATNEKERACTDIAALGSEVNGVAPLLASMLDAAIREYEKDAPHWIHAASSAIAYVCPDDMASRAAQDRAVDVLLAALAAPKGTDADEKARNVNRTLELLLPLTTSAPTTRSKIVAAVTPHLADDKLREGAARVLGACGADAEPAKEAMRELRLKVGGKAVLEPLKQIDEQLRVVPLLAKAGLKPGDVPPWLFEFACKVVDGGKASDAIKPLRDCYAFRTARSLARVEAPAARKEALAILGSWGREEKTMRPAISKLLVQLAEEPALTDLASRWLALCGPDGARAVREAKSSAWDKVVDALYALAFPANVFNQADLSLPTGWYTEEVTLESFQAMHELRVTDSTSFHILHSNVRSGNSKEFKTAAESMQHFGPAEARYLPYLVRTQFEIGPKAKALDAERYAALTRIIENIVSPAKRSPKSYPQMAVLAILDPKAEVSHKAEAIDMVLHWTRGESYQRPHLETFAKEITDPKERQAFLAVFAEKMHYDTAINLGLSVFSREEAGPILAQPYIRQLKEHYLRKEPTLSETTPFDVLRRIGPKAGPEAKAVILQCIAVMEKSTHLGSRRDYILSQAREVLAVFKDVPLPGK